MFKNGTVRGRPKVGHKYIGYGSINLLRLLSDLWTPLTSFWEKIAVSQNFVCTLY